jgi:hypothetical protein
MTLCESWPELWFDADPDEAVAACCRCPLIVPCGKTAMEREGTETEQYRFGVWGGLTPEQRATLAAHDRRLHQ